MQIERLSPDEYAKTYTPQHVFNSVDFTELNRDKAEYLHYLSVHDTKHRFGIILGERNGMLRSPFSAPFGGFTTRCVQTLERMEEAVDLLPFWPFSAGRSAPGLPAPARYSGCRWPAVSFLCSYWRAVLSAPSWILHFLSCLAWQQDTIAFRPPTVHIFQILFAYF